MNKPVIMKVNYDVYNGDKDTEVFTFKKMHNAIEQGKKKANEFLESHGFTEDDFKGEGDTFKVYEDEVSYSFYAEQNQNYNRFEVLVYYAEFEDADETKEETDESHDMYVVTASFDYEDGSDNLYVGAFTDLNAAENFAEAQKADFRDSVSNDGALDDEVTDESNEDIHNNGTLYRFFGKSQVGNDYVSVQIRKIHLLDEPDALIITKEQRDIIKKAFKLLGVSYKLKDISLEKALKGAEGTFNDYEIIGKANNILRDIVEVHKEEIII
ncbi:hypothetical protein [Bacillus bombysepticus]|uniref:hypothetical protein n=1 Tax=Bacillus bombysepticus TaxID=658666 RepID=UPI003017C4DC